MSGSAPILAAYVVARDAALSAQDLREYLAQRLPKHMLPQATTLLESMPLTTSGKVDRSALPAPANESGRAEIGERARTPAEETLSRIWKEVLCVDEVGVHDNFFELGGDSLLSIRIISRASQAGLAMTPKQFFDNPTIAGVMAAITGGEASDAELESELLSLGAHDAEELLKEVEDSGERAGES